MANNFKHFLSCPRSRIRMSKVSKSWRNSEIPPLWLNFPKSFWYHFTPSTEQSYKPIPTILHALYWKCDTLSGELQTNILMAKSIKVSGNVGGKRVLALLLLLQSYSWETARISFVYPDNSHNKYKYWTAIVSGLRYYEWELKIYCRVASDWVTQRST